MAQIKVLKIANSLPTEHDGTADDLTVLSLSSDTISERTATAGVTVDGTLLKDGGIDLATNASFSINGTNIVVDSAGTATLSNIDALDATTEATIEAAIDTLSNLTAASSLVTVGTITTGTWNADAITVAYGGSGRATATAYAVICGGTTATGAHQSIASVGSSGQVLTSNGAGALPTFQNVSATLTVTYTNGNAGAIAKGDVVYLESGVNDTVELADADTIAHGEQLVGIVSDASISAAASGEIEVMPGRVITGILTAATAGDIYYLSTAGTTGNTLTATAPSGGPALVRIGIAKNATDLIYDPQFIADTTA